MNYFSFGHYPRVSPSAVWSIDWRDQAIPFANAKQFFLCYAQGKSYGDSCLNENGILLDTKRMNRFIAFDAQSGRLRCEAGMTFAEILRVIVPRGWFLPVVAGTQFISLGGAIANDIHGKNHHRSGTLGRDVKCFELLRSNGERLLCSPQQNKELYQATIGGLGLTGMITWAEIQLIPIQNAYLEVEKIKFKNLEEFFAINKASEKEYAYTVAWLDCLAQGEAFGRGIFMRANHAEQQLDSKQCRTPTRKISMPFYLPNKMLNPMTMKAFNNFYYHQQRPEKKIVHYQSFFFQLDAIHQWNKIYGKRGFFQYQCVMPDENQAVIMQLLQRVVASGQGSFLSVLKTFGDLSSPGMLSFPKKGVTLALDFPNQGEKTLALLNELDVMVVAHQGRVYPAKDARMSAATFQYYYPQWQAFAQFKDPQFSSSFWRRVTA